MGKKRMPLSINDTFDLPYYAPSIRVALEPARSLMQSLLMLTSGHSQSGMSDWVINTVQVMTPQERATHDLVLLGLHYAVLPQETWNSFPAYVDHLAAMQPEALREKMLNEYERIDHNPDFSGPWMDLASALESPENYLAYLRQRFPPQNVDEAIERKSYRYVVDPPALQRVVVEHLRHMWERYLAEEWERVRPILQEIVRAYRGVDLKDKSFMEAAKLIIGRDLDEEKWTAYFNQARRVIFVPNLHVGPYLPKCLTPTGEAFVHFSAHLPDWMIKDTPDLTRTEINIRLNALADDTRLRILRYLAENGEQRSQVIMEALELSQSAASRHLTQLSTAGFLSERRCEGAKCYALQPERVSNTLQAIADFLQVKERIGS